MAIKRNPKVAQLWRKTRLVKSTSADGTYITRLAQVRKFQLLVKDCAGLGARQSTKRKLKDEERRCIHSGLVVTDGTRLDNPLRDDEVVNMLNVVLY